MENIKRDEQKLENTWDLTRLYKTEEDFQKDYDKTLEMIQQYGNYQGHILDSAENLYEVLKLDTEVSRLLEKLATYAYRLHDVDITNPQSQTLRGRVDNLIQKAGTVSSFIVPELLKEDYQKILEYIEEKKELKDYQKVLERIFRKKNHILSEKEEKLLSEFGLLLDAPSKIAGVIRNAEIPIGKIHDEEGQEVQLTNENYVLYVESKDRQVRKEAFETLYKAYSSFKDTFTETIQGEVKKNATLAKLKNYPSSRFASLFQDRVSEDVYENLIQVVHEHLDTVYKYFDLKKQVSGLKDYCLYDTYLNLSEGETKKYSFEEAKKIVLDVVQVFGEEYVSNIQRAFTERWIDIYPNQGKRGGAYSSGSYDTLPYILLNYQGTYNDVSTLIHELGHSMHSLYSNQNNLPQYSSYKIFVAEVASTVNELLLNFYMLEHSQDKEEKKMILSEMMDTFKGTLFRQTMFSEFEEFMHEEVEKDHILTSDMLCQKYYELNELYFGKNVIINDEIRYEWMRIPHFYYNFYVYQYATGLSCACFIVNRIRNKEKGAVEDYLNFLKTGDSLDPIEELKVAGCDITKKEVIESAISMFDSLIEEYKSLDK